MRTRLVSLAAVLVNGLYFREIFLRIYSFNSHTSVVRAALSIREHTALLLLVVLSIIQALLCVALVSPQLHSKLGALSSCVALATTSVLETIIYGSLVDSFHTRKVVLTVCAVTILGLFRNESNARSTAIDTPIGDRWVNVHANIRRFATKYHVARYAVPLSFLASLRMLWFSLSSSHGMQAEVNATAASTSASVCAIFLIIGGLDTSESLTDIYYDVVVRYERLLGCMIRERNKKKNKRL